MISFFFLPKIIIFLKTYLFIWKRAREQMPVRVRERERISSWLPTELRALAPEWGGVRWAQSQDPWDHDLSWNQESDA